MHVCCVVNGEAKPTSCREGEGKGCGGWWQFKESHTAAVDKSPVYFLYRYTGAARLVKLTGWASQTSS